MSDGGKGDKRRPSQVSQEELKERWEAIFPPKKMGRNPPPIEIFTITKEEKPVENLCPTRCAK